MSDRAGRVAENESVFRAFNEEVEALNRGLAQISDETLHIVCECGDLGYTEQLVVTVA